MFIEIQKNDLISQNNIKIIQISSIQGKLTLYRHFLAILEHFSFSSEFFRIEINICTSISHLRFTWHHTCFQTPYQASLPSWHCQLNKQTSLFVSIRYSLTINWSNSSFPFIYLRIIFNTFNNDAIFFHRNPSEASAELDWMWNIIFVFLKTKRRRFKDFVDIFYWINFAVYHS